MSARSKARKRALDLLYSADLRETPLPDALADAAARAAGEPEREGSWRYAHEIVNGVIEHSAEIDELIQTYAHGWTLKRMPVVDRAILRVAVWEILWNDEVPTGVAISEAVESATELSTEDSAGFVNGLLARIAHRSASSDQHAHADASQPTQLGSA